MGKEDDLKKLLVDGENLIHEYKISMYSILATNKRLIISEKFPKNLSEVDYKDIELVEYYTIIRWKELFIGIGCIIIAIVLYLEYQSIISVIPALLPQPQSGQAAQAIIDILPTIKIIITVISLGIISFGLYSIGMFAFSFIGRFRILVYEQAPIEVMGKLTPELEQLIKFIDEKRKINGNNKEKK